MCLGRFRVRFPGASDSQGDNEIRYNVLCREETITCPWKKDNFFNIRVVEQGALYVVLFFCVKSYI